MMNAQNTVVSEVLTWLANIVPQGTRLCLDSRQIRSGDVFVALRGTQGKGTAFVSQAIEKGAVAVLSDDPEMILPSGFAACTIPNLRASLGEIAHHWYGKPSEQLKVIAVTGTNGKTTTVNWIAQVLNACQVPCASMGTLGTILPNGQNLASSLTTPDVLSMHDLLRQCVQNGVKVVALEASSIGIEQGRLDGVEIDYAGFTNLTLDHLDYHGTMQNYAHAKAKLFAWRSLKRAAFNLDTLLGRELLQEYPAAMTYGYESEKAGVRALNIQVEQARYDLYFEGRTYPIQNQCYGLHNIANQLLLVCLLSSLLPIEQLVQALNQLQAVDGRLESVGIPDTTGFSTFPKVIVDYAHTPDALAHSLNTLKALGKRLICVFGCGGDRDRSKRPVMGKIAMDLADDVYVTSDNPRTEDPECILQEIVRELPKKPRCVESNRAVAIMQAILQANVDDVILIAGKGHETYQEINGQRLFFDDRQWAKLALLMRQACEVSTDTRLTKANDLFVALRGERFDAHDFLGDVHARAAIVERPNPHLKLLQIQVADTAAALADMATAYRRQFDMPVIAVTGSNGKTSCKEMIASILNSASSGHYLATQGNLNNHIGVPLTLLKLRSHHRYAVVELGINHIGEMAFLAAMAQPTISLVNNAQREHQEFMQNVETVAYENGQVLRALSAKGVAIFPAKDEFTSLWKKMSEPHAYRLFGESGKVWATGVHTTDQGVAFNLHIDNECASVQLSIVGEHNVHNALAATACADAAGIAFEDIVQGLRNFEPAKGRLQRYSCPQGLLIDDTYNANPDSVRAAVDVLATQAQPRILVLGDMAEVGQQSEQYHAEVGAYAKQRGIDILLTKGSAVLQTAKAFGEGARHFEHFDDLIHDLKLKKGTILVKGSRSAQMEMVVNALKAE